VKLLSHQCQIKYFAVDDLLTPYFSPCAAVNKDELLQMVRFGAEMVFSSGDSTITDEDIDRIIAKGEEATAELDAKMKKFTEDALKFKMDDSMWPPPFSALKHCLLYLILFPLLV